MLWLLACVPLPAVSQATGQYKYRVWLADKPAGQYGTDAPQEFLSPAALERRSRQGIGIDTTDLPVYGAYVDAIAACGVRPVVTSRWLNTVVVALDDTSLLDAVRQLPFVAATECVWRGDGAASTLSHRKLRAARRQAADVYASSYEQIAMLGIDSLHAAGYRGEGMDIAVIDVGFSDVDDNPTIAQDRIAGVRDFVHGTFSYDGDTHGAMVLSCMLSDEPGTYVGSAPGATYRLLVSEDNDSEYPVEEDYWVAAVEWADSAGVDVVNTSLGYYAFDDPAMSYTHDDLDGSTAFSSRAAAMAAAKGMMLLVAAGNEGNAAWRKIIVPADADGILAVGAVSSDGVRASFSSVGNSADGRIKPEVMAVGSGTRMVIDSRGVISSSGTSFATPVLCGGVACLWQAHPEWTVARLREEVIRSSSRYASPDCYMGYGIPNLYAAHRSAAAVASLPREDGRRVAYADGCLLLPQPAGCNLHFTLYDMAGRLCGSGIIVAGDTRAAVSLPAGFYVAVVTDGSRSTASKVTVTR